MLLKIEDLWEKSLGKIFDFSSNKSLGFNTSIIDGKFSSPKTFFPFFFCLFLHPEGTTLAADDVDGQMLTVWAAKPGSLWVLDSQLETEIH